jgi:hypothetical protein
MALTKVTKSGLADDSVDASKLEDGTIVAADINDGTITNDKLAGSIANAKLANSSITVNGSAVSLGGSITSQHINWQAVVTADGSTETTATAGYGYFIDTTNHAHTINLPSSPSAGDYVAIKDYAANFQNNSCTIGRNGSNIQGNASNSELKTTRASAVLVYVDGTKGWLYTNESNVQYLGPTYVAATGGTVTTSGDYKVHVFTSSSNFVVSDAGHPATSNTVDYLVVAGGGGAGGDGGAGGGAGGFRVSNSYSIPAPTMSPLSNPTGITAAVQTYPITVGGGGSAVPTGNAPSGQSTDGSNSVFSTITSAGGGSAGDYNAGNGPAVGQNGGSGGGGSRHIGNNDGGTGNTPPVSPPQGNNGGTGNGTTSSSGGGGGAGAAGQNGYGPLQNGDGGDGSYISTDFSLPGNGTPGPVSGTRYFAGGGGGGGNTPSPNQFTNAGGVGGGGQGFNGDVPGPEAGATVTAGTTNTGGGGAGGGNDYGGSNGGSGVVILRYKYQN